MCSPYVGSPFGSISVCKEDVGSPFGRIPSEVAHSCGSETSWEEPMTGLHKDFNCWTVGSVGKTLPSCKAEADKGGQRGDKVH